MTSRFFIDSSRVFHFGPGVGRYRNIKALHWLAWGTIMLDLPLHRHELSRTIPVLSTIQRVYVIGTVAQDFRPSFFFIIHTLNFFPVWFQTHKVIELKYDSRRMMQR
jgi:hypothetical protein